VHLVRLLRPAQGLGQFVRCYAQREVQIHNLEVMVPVPARAAPLIEFVFGHRFKVAYCARAALETSPAAVVVGLQTHRRLQLHFQEAVECFVILFQPTGLHRLFSIPMHELTDQNYEAHSVLGAFISRLEQRLSDCKSFAARASLVDEFLLHRASLSRGYDAISAAANQIVLRGGRERIAPLAHGAGLSMRQFERRFIQQVGVGPKLYSRIARFEAALDSKARSSTKSWTDVAHEFGYHDQMHLVHDFEEFTGETPTDTLSQFEMVFREQIKAMRSGRLSEDANGHSRLIL